MMFGSRCSFIHNLNETMWSSAFTHDFNPVTHDFNPVTHAALWQTISKPTEKDVNQILMDSAAV